FAEAAVALCPPATDGVIIRASFPEPMPRRRLVIIAPALRPLLIVLATGTIGFWLIDGVPLWDAFFLTVITVTRVGYRVVFPLSTAGLVLTVMVVVLGIGTVAYGVGEYFTTVRSNLARRRLMREIHRLSSHLIVCGYGRVGQNVTATLLDSGRQVLVVDKDEARVEQARRDGVVAALGDATQDDVMSSLGVEQAAGFLVTTGSDTDNLFIVLSARTLNPRMTIVARAGDAGNAAKFRRAGANRVVSPYEAGGRYMANCMVRPNLTEFLDRVTLAGVELWLEEIRVPEDREGRRTIAELDLPRRTGASLVAVSHSPGELITAPVPGTELGAGDVLIVLGTKDQLSQVERVVHHAG
ncbi:MAG: TrkA family potassium uptake protein, partial [Gemmatimonadales bacterium]